MVLVLGLVSLVLFVVRVYATAHVGFGDSEALYACYALHPQPAYLDHPGLVGTVARLVGGGTAPSPLAAHVVTSLAATAFPWVMVLACRAASAPWRRAMAAGIVVSLVPEIALGLFALVRRTCCAPSRGRSASRQPRRRCARASGKRRGDGGVRGGRAARGHRGDLEGDRARAVRRAAGGVRGDSGAGACAHRRAVGRPARGPPRRRTVRDPRGAHGVAHAAPPSRGHAGIGGALAAKRRRARGRTARVPLAPRRRARGARVPRDVAGARDDTSGRPAPPRRARSCPSRRSFRSASGAASPSRTGSRLPCSRSYPPRHEHPAPPRGASSSRAPRWGASSSPRSTRGPSCRRPSASRPPPTTRA